ncbi:cytochrome c [Amylibacter marinus]|uniref:Cytochrome c1 n=1 Tax=Amylibacter marinus TaxID=1475483 RepID=A0ABQ5VV43_9RHOB|nr:cytochrome c1 [Amylibacter marinus]GLQ35300.1 cytochrome c [Amylibacter marinus]
MKKFMNTAFSALVAVSVATGAFAAGGEGHIEDVDFSFETPFGKFDQHQLQRGLIIYKDVCAACHGLKFVAFRTLGDEGGPHLTADQVKAFAAEHDVFDPEIDDFRTAKPSDKFPTSSESHIPDLSLMAKARAGFHGPYGLGINQITKGMGGAEYIASILTGYTGKEKEQAGQVFYENTAFPGGWIAMAPPLADQELEFADGHDGTDPHHLAEDVAAFLMWTAEPKMMARQKLGFVSVGMLLLLSVLLYLTNKSLWRKVKYK